MYNEDDLLMLSALQHLLFCSRQCALVHIEQLWIENRRLSKDELHAEE
jgi:CRISPR-associated exonuclease Cas4